jgi:hypothetical protein
MTSSQYGPYGQGCTRTTMPGTMGSNVARRSKSSKPDPVQIVVCNSTAVTQAALRSVGHVRWGVAR